MSLSHEEGSPWPPLPSFVTCLEVRCKTAVYTDEGVVWIFETNFRDHKRVKGETEGKLGR